MTELQTALDKSLSLMKIVLDTPHPSPLSKIARAANLPITTAHRLLASLQNSGLIVRIGRNSYVSGPALRSLGLMQKTPRHILADVGKPILSALSRRTGRITHLGVFEDNMMTYLVKEGDPEDKALSRPDVQLEAYCTGVGKALLAHLPEGEREAYLSTAPFVSITKNTITSANALREEFARIRESGYALDMGEMFDGLFCIAVPVRVNDHVVAAISLVATRAAQASQPVRYLARLQAAASRIESQLAAAADIFAPAP